jgi:hypothetical protein
MTAHCILGGLLCAPETSIQAFKDLALLGLVLILAVLLLPWQDLKRLREKKLLFDERAIRAVQRELRPASVRAVARRWLTVEP